MLPPAFYDVSKTPSLAQGWEENENGVLTLVVPLEIGGVTVSGLVLRGKTLAARPDQDVMFQIECLHGDRGGRRDRALARIDWRPLHSHNNRGRGPEEWRFFEQIGTHHHAFGLNWLDDEQRMRSANLPIAVPLNPEPSTYDELVAFVEETFRINNLGTLPPPQWTANLL